VWVDSWPGCCGRKRSLLLPLEQFVVIYNLITEIHTDCAAHLASFSSNWGSFLGIKRPGREIDHRIPLSAEPWNEWIYKCTASLCLHTVDRVKCTF
jgi:uncharacterized protein YijF (DUF1287 family)